MPCKISALVLGERVHEIKQTTSKGPKTLRRWIFAKRCSLKWPTSLSKQNGSPIKLLKIIYNRHKSEQREKERKCGTDTKGESLSPTNSVMAKSIRLPRSCTEWKRVSQRHSERDWWRKGRMKHTLSNSVSQRISHSISTTGTKRRGTRSFPDSAADSFTT